jgi:hypothetical protein
MKRLHGIQTVIGVLLLCGSIAWGQTDAVLPDEIPETTTTVAVEVAPKAVEIGTAETVTAEPGSGRGRMMGGRGGMYGMSGMAGASYGEVVQSSTNRRVGELQSLATQLAGSPGRVGSGTDAVLVIPSGDIPVETMKTIREDMTIMSRIFHKRLGRGGGYGMATSYYLGSLYGNYLNGDSSAGEVIYLQDYGALFMFRTKMSLLPPSKTEEKIATDDVTDPLWAETKQELQAGPGSRYYPWKADTRRVRTGSLPHYDAEKVAELKQNLLKALRHASNIRSLQADEWITVVVIGEAAPTLAQKMVVSKSGGHNIEEDVLFFDLMDPQSASGRTILTVRVKKADVDAAAKKEITQAEFEKRVKMFTYAAGGGAQPQPTSMGLSLPAPSQTNPPVPPHSGSNAPR